MTEEKGVLGFCLSGHLFNAYAAEARQFAKTRIVELEPSRDPKWVAGVISGNRTQMTQRGKMMIVTLDDGSGTIEVTIFSELMDQKRPIFKEDEFLAVFGKVSEDRFSGGLRLNADDALDISGSRLHFGQHISFTLPEKFNLAKLKEAITPWQTEDGIRLIADYIVDGNKCRIDFGANCLLGPNDECLNSLSQQFKDAKVTY